MSDPGVSTHLCRTPPSEILLTDFFGGVAGGVEVTDSQLVIAKGDGWEASSRAVDDDSGTPSDSVRPLRATVEPKGGVVLQPPSSSVTPAQTIVGAVALAAAGAAVLAFQGKQ